MRGEGEGWRKRSKMGGREEKDRGRRERREREGGKVGGGAI